MKALCTGTSGCDKNGYLEGVVELASKNKKRVSVLHVGNTMKEVSEELGYKISKETVLDLEDSRLQSLRMSAYQRIARKMSEDENRCFLIDTHSSFLWRGTFLSALTPAIVDTLSPDIFVTMIDDVHSVKRRLESDPQWSRAGLSLKELLMWREQEIHYTRNEANRLNKPHYILARRHPESTLYDLVFNADRKKIYLSYPMTYVGPRGFQEIRRFADELRNHFIVFDPSTITESSLDEDLKKARKDAKKSKEKPPEEIVVKDQYGLELKISMQEIEDALTNVTGQIVTRDYALVDQSDAVVILMHRDVMSVGVICEMVYGDTHGKDVYVVSPRFHEKPSPFMSYHVDKILPTTSALLEFMTKETEK